MKGNNLVFKTEKKKKIKIKPSKEKEIKYLVSEDKKSPFGQKKKYTVGQKVWYILKIFIFTMIGLAVCGASVLGIIIYNWTKDMPELDLTLLSGSSQSTYIYDKYGNLVTKYSGFQNKEWADYDEFPQQLIDAITCIEDKRFFEHNGIDQKRFVGAIIGQLTGGDDYGGSTITQQLIKNVYLTSEITYKRKVQELFLALKLEKELSKEEILEAYLNIIYLGGSNYGMKAAALDYFGKDLKDLSIRECAMLAGLTQNPNGYSPRNNYDAGDMTPTNDRTDTVLYVMNSEGKITEEEYNKALLEEVKLVKVEKDSELYPYPQYIEYVLDEVAEEMLKAEGGEITDMNIAYKKYSLRYGGYKIYTNLDTKIQEQLQTSASEFDFYPDTEDGNGCEVSAVVMDHAKGEIVAMIGSKDEPEAFETYNRAVYSTQPVASTLKPIAIYAPAIEKGLGTGTPILDYKIPISGYDDQADGYPGGECSTYPLTMRKTLELSHNIPAARLLMNNVGMSTSVDYLLQLGISKNHITEDALGIALGTSGITTLEMTGAYSALANKGTYIQPHAYSKVINRKDEVVLDASETVKTRKVFSEETAYMTTDMLISQVDNMDGQTAKIPDMETAGKTGTHEDKCILFAGYTHYYTSVLRISSDSYSSLYGATGSKQAAMLWKNYMEPIHKDLKNEEIIPYDSINVKEVLVCTISGQLATDCCKEMGHSKIEMYKSGTEPTDKCTMHLAVCKKTEKLASDRCYRDNMVKYITFIPEGSYLSEVPSSLLYSSIEGCTFTHPEGYCDSSHWEEEKKEDIEQDEPPTEPPVQEEIEVPNESPSALPEENDNTDDTDVNTDVSEPGNEVSHD